MRVRRYKIRKKNGAYRRIVAPDRKWKDALRKILDERLTPLQVLLCDPDIVHGFYPGHSPVTNAEKHIGYMFTLTCDLSNFFESVVSGHFKTGLPNLMMLPGCQDQGIVAQGFPTSPAIANIAAVQMDEDLRKWCEPRKIVYTRYADDLSFSAMEKDCLIELRTRLSTPPVNLKHDMLHGFELNPTKTRMQYAGYNFQHSRIITGIAVGKDGIRLPRNQRKKLRAALHAAPDAPRTRGLMEWSKLKTPKERKIETGKMQAELLGMR